MENKTKNIKKKDTKTNSKKKEKIKKESKFKAKVDNFTEKQIFLISLIPFFGIALFIYFENDKIKSKKSMSGFKTGMLITFLIGIVMGVILWVMK